MATIDSLNISITQLSHSELMSKVMAIRTNRRRRPERTMRAQKAVPAKVARSNKKKSLTPADPFAIFAKLDDEVKAKLAAEILGGMK